jgi:UDP-N-acetylglucosamine--N-acetylmuramyl-(pentapeptide) pyrophosphoryl-undecaprenol N-acetylglucosamine transferase
VKVLVAAGGTAGHILPALALAHRLTEAHGAEVRFVGTPTGQEARLVPAAGFAFDAVDARPLPRTVSIDTLTAPVAALRAVGACTPLVDRADVVVGMGGYVSVPVGLAAARRRRPLVLHEQNAVPGLANRVLSRRATAVALTFAEAARGLSRRGRLVVTGNPVRERILAVSERREELAAEAVGSLDLEAPRKTIVVFGGSQGALHVNTATVDAIRVLRERSDLQVLLLTGRAHEDRIRDALGDTGDVRVRIVGYLERMELAYAMADLVVSRAGATTCAEIAVCGVGSILVPYPHATGRHQEANARALERVGAATVLMDDSLSGDALAAGIRGLLDDQAHLRSMGERARSWSRPEAAEALAAVVLHTGGRA